MLHPKAQLMPPLCKLGSFLPSPGEPKVQNTKMKETRIEHTLKGKQTKA